MLKLPEMIDENGFPRGCSVFELKPYALLVSERFPLTVMGLVFPMVSKSCACANKLKTKKKTIYKNR